MGLVFLDILNVLLPAFGLVSAFDLGEHIIELLGDLLAGLAGESEGFDLDLVSVDLENELFHYQFPTLTVMWTSPVSIVSVLTS